jgi:hypothetical protein
MWTYEQRTGRFLDVDGEHIATGYSGFGPCRNDPATERLAGLGPLPRGRYHIGHEVDSSTRGPVVLPLTPVGHDAHGRSGFLIHGDSREHPGQASHGCIILPRAVREMISDSEDRELLVTSGEPDGRAVA